MNLKWSLFKDSMVYGRKRKQTTRNITATVVSIVTALIVALLVATALGYNPFDILAKLFYVGFNDPITLFSNIGVFCFAGFAFAFASKAGLFNIGISGQMLAAGTVVVFMTTKWIPVDALPNGVGQIVALFVAMLAGGLVALFVGALDVYLRINSVVSSILLNWIIYFISFFLLATYAREPGDQLTNSLLIPDNYRLWDTIWGTGGIIPITILTVIVGIILWAVFKYTIFGHKIKAVGLSADGSRYAGYDVNFIKLCSFTISGMLAGVLACVLYTSTSIPSIGLNVTVDTIPIEGFNGIVIALISNNNPYAIIAVSALFGLFQNSIPGIEIPTTYINVLLGLLMLGAAMSVVVYKWKPWLKLKAFRYGAEFSKSNSSFENRFDALISKYKSLYMFEKRNIYQQEGEKLSKKAMWDETLQEIIEDYQTEHQELLEAWVLRKTELRATWPDLKIQLKDEACIKEAQSLLNELRFLNHLDDKGAIDAKTKSLDESLLDNEPLKFIGVRKLSNAAYAISKISDEKIKNDLTVQARAINHYAKSLKPVQQGGE